MDCHSLRVRWDLGDSSPSKLGLQQRLILTPTCSLYRTRQVGQGLRNKWKDSQRVVSGCFWYYDAVKSEVKKVIDFLIYERRVGYNDIYAKVNAKDNCQACSGRSLGRTPKI